MKSFIHACVLCSIMTSPAYAESSFTNQSWSAKCTFNKRNGNIIVSTNFSQGITKDQIIRASIWQAAVIANEVKFDTIMFSKFQCSEMEFAGSKAGGDCLLVARDISGLSFIKDKSSSKKLVIIVEKMLIDGKSHNLDSSQSRCPLDRLFTN